MAQIIKQADIAVGNLESPLVPSKIRLSEKFPGPKIIFVSAEPNSAPALRFVSHLQIEHKFTKVDIKLNGKRLKFKMIKGSCLFYRYDSLI